MNVTPEDATRQAGTRLTELLEPRGWHLEGHAGSVMVWEWPPSQPDDDHEHGGPTLIELYNAGTSVRVRVDPATTDIFAAKYEHRYLELDDLVPGCLDEIESWRA